MKFLMNIFVAVVALLTTNAAMGRFITSGGGHLFEDQINPWFLDNTTNVSYCIESSEEFSSQKIDFESLVASVLEDWRSSLSRLMFIKSENPVFHIDLGTQTFTREECANSTDLRIQFGVLHSWQKKKNIGGLSTIAEAVRTSYDPVTLKGKGFIYIAPDNGPRKPTKMVKDIWTLGGGIVLKRVLEHELGHVFLGARHWHGFELMEERFPEAVASGKILVCYGNDSCWKNFVSRRMIEPEILFSGRTYVSEISNSEDFHEYSGAFEIFELPYKTKKVKFELLQKITGNVLRISKANSTGNDFIPFGESEPLQILKINFTKSDMLFLTAEQELVPKQIVGLKGEAFLQGQIFEKAFLSGKMTLTNGLKRNVMVAVDKFGKMEIHASDVLGNLKVIYVSPLQSSYFAF